MRTVTASEFKAKCLKLMDQVARSGEPILITKKGKPVCRLEPAAGAKARLFGLYADRLEIVGDPTAPLDVEWESMARHW
jgi:prevent-host-death family protein